MKRTLRVLVVLLTAACALAQTANAPPDPYKPVLDRLQSITAIPLAVWQTHAGDLAHGEDPALSPADWQSVEAEAKTGEGSRWLRQTFEVPAQLNGYSLQGSRIALDLHVGSDDAIQISVFSNGNMVARTDEDGQVPITLIENAQPGQKLILRCACWTPAVEVAAAVNATRIESAAAAHRAAVQPSRPGADAAGDSLGPAAHRRLSRRQSASASSNSTPR